MRAPGYHILGTYGVQLVVVLFALRHSSQTQGTNVRNTTGRVQLYHRNAAGVQVWTDIVTQELDVRAQKVLCRSMDLPTDDVSWEKDGAPPFQNVVPLDVACIGNETDITQCAMHLRQNPVENDGRVILQCRGLRFELLGGGSDHGLVTVNHRGSTLQPVCGSPQVDGRMATIVCQSLGLPSSQAVLMYPYMYTGYIGLVQALRLIVTCPDNNITDCQLHTTNEDEICTHPYSGLDGNKVLAVYCTDTELKYQLNVLPGESIGRLEVEANNTWGPVCIKTADLMYPETPCKAMGLPNTNARFYKGLYNGGEFDQGHLVLRDCLPNPADPRRCYPFLGPACRTHGYLALHCENATGEGQIRLYGGLTSPNNGVLQLYHRDRWWGVGVSDSRSPTLFEGQLVCSTLNFSTNGVTVGQTSPFYILWLRDIDCDGTETKILDCSNTSLGAGSKLTSGSALKVSCGMEEDDLKLEADGLLMVRHNSRWGTVTSHHFNNVAAAVFCKAMNKPSTLASWSTGSNTPPRTGTIWPELYVCNSTDDILENCRKRQFGYQDGSHAEDVHITCDQLDKASVDYRLANKPLPDVDVGFVEIRVNNVWGSVCDDGFTDEAAKVVCRSLNKRTDGAKVLGSFKGLEIVTSKVWLDGVKCAGTEASLLDCPRNYLGSENCAKFWHKPVAVYCGKPYSTEDFSLRLVGPGSTSGRLEVMVFGEWGTVCDTSFDEAAAQVACTQMGLMSFRAEVAKKDTYEIGSGQIWLSNISCSVYEDNLVNCDSFTFGNTGCTHEQDVGVVCKGFDHPSPDNHLGVILGSVFGSVLGICLVILVRSKPFLRRMPCTRQSGQVAYSSKTASVTAMPGH